MPYLLENKRTGWKGAVTESMYERLRDDPEYRRIDASELEPGPEPEPEEDPAPSYYHPEEEEGFHVKPTGNGWYDVVDSEGEAWNEKKLRQGEAEDLLNELTD